MRQRRRISARTRRLAARDSRHPGNERGPIQLIAQLATVIALCFMSCLPMMTVNADVLTLANAESLQTLITRAKPGDTIRVEGGVHIGQVILDKTLTLEGTGRPVLRGVGKGSVVVALANRCVIRGFVIEHSGRDLQAEDSGLLLKSNDNLVEDNLLRDVLFGIYLYHSERNTIRGNDVRGRSELGTGERGAGLHLWNSPGNLIEGNTITEARDGMYIQASHGNTIRRNRVSRLRYGLHFMNSDDNTFDDNVFEHNIAGAAIMYSKRVQLRRNAFLHNRGFSSFGVLLQDCQESTAENNFIVDNATGIFMESVRRSSFRRNVIAENDLALMIYSSSNENLFTENNFVDNLSPLQIVGKRAGVHWGAAGRGNYWSDYKGYDLDGDGIGDIGHRVQNVFEYLEGNYPRLRLYLNSPAAQALATAEESFPIIRVSTEADTWPLMHANKLAFTLEQRESRASVDLALALVSVAMVASATIVMMKSHQRKVR